MTRARIARFPGLNVETLYTYAGRTYAPESIGLDLAGYAWLTLRSMVCNSLTNSRSRASGGA
jgi:hypothetical protein